MLLPGAPPPSGATQDLPAKYANSAFDSLWKGLQRQGATASSTRGVLVGGARMFQSDADLEQGVGQRNVESLRLLLNARGIKLAAEDTGGTQGRTVIFELPECRLRLRTLRGGWSEKTLK